MLQGGLFFGLGFLVAVLLALMAAPAIWRRAVILTRKRIEASVPLKLNEIQADKDTMRAEFAMKQRKLEVGQGHDKNKMAEQFIDLGRTRDDLLATKEDNVQKIARIDELEAQATELRAQIQSSEERLNVASTNLTSLEMKLEEKTLAHDELAEKYRDTIDDFDGQQIEMVARENRMGTVQEEVLETKQLLKETDSQRKRAAEDAKTMAANLRTEQKRNAALEERMAKLQSDQSDAQQRLERRDRDIAQLRERVSGTSVAGIGDNGAELAEMRERVQTVEGQRDALQMRNEELLVRLNEDSSSDQNALVRERISALADQVTALATTGAKSTKQAKAKPRAKSAPKSTTPKKPASSSKRGKSEKSLADRIRAVNEASEKA